MYAVAWLKMLSLFTLKVWQEIWSHFIPLFLILHFKDNTFLFDYQRNGFKNFAFPS